MTINIEIQIQTEIGLVFIKDVNEYGDVYIKIRNDADNNFVTVNNKLYSGWFKVDRACLKKGHINFKRLIDLEKTFYRRKTTGEYYQNKPSKSEIENIMNLIWKTIEKECEKPEFISKIEALTTIVKNRLNVENLARLVTQTKERLEQEQRRLVEQDIKLVNASDSLLLSMDKLSHLFES